MNNDRFLLEFCDAETNDVIETSNDYWDYLAALAHKDLFVILDTSAALMAHQKMEVNSNAV